MSRLIIVDPWLLSHGGHHFNFDLSIIEQAQKRGFQYATLAHRNLIEESLRQKVQAVPVFEWHQYSAVPSWVMEKIETGEIAAPGQDLPTDELAERWFSGYLNTYFSEVFKVALDPLVENGDMIVFHSLNARMLSAVAQWTLQATRRKRCVVALLLMATDYMRFATMTFGWQAHAYKAALNTLVGVNPDQLLITAETQPIADHVALLADHRIPIGVSDHFKPESLLSELMPQGEFQMPDLPLTLGYFGHSRFERGTQLLPDVVPQILERFPGQVEFKIQINLTYYEGWRHLAPDLPQRLDSLRGLANVELLTGELMSKDFYRYMAGSDLLLMPYSGRYVIAGSGLFWEGLALGKPMLVPAGSYLAEAVAAIDGGGVLMAEPTVESLVAAISEAVETYETIARKAWAAGPQWHRDHSPAHFLEEMTDRLARVQESPRASF
ncbi:hypothetical protein JCM17960_34250 [Magnetospira thiophila]